MVFCPYNTVIKGLGASGVRGTIFCALHLTAFVCQGRMVFCPYNTVIKGSATSGVDA